jgi:hypothetical protein
MVLRDCGSAWRGSAGRGLFAGLSPYSFVEIVHQPSFDTDMAVDIISAATYY